MAERRRPRSHLGEQPALKVHAVHDLLGDGVRQRANALLVGECAPVDVDGVVDHHAPAGSRSAHRRGPSGGGFAQAERPAPSWGQTSGAIFRGPQDFIAGKASCVARCRSPLGKGPIERLAELAPAGRISRVRVVDAGRIITAGGLTAGIGDGIPSPMPVPAMTSPSWRRSPRRWSIPGPTSCTLTTSNDGKASGLLLLARW
jgi:hypothetical protein